jgi:hypothetical protein
MLLNAADNVTHPLPSNMSSIAYKTLGQLPL